MVGATYVADGDGRQVPAPDGQEGSELPFFPPSALPAQIDTTASCWTVASTCSDWVSLCAAGRAGTPITGSSR